jgi:LytR cell envelope-related transcriptional attenuator
MDVALRPWRTAALVASALAIAELVVLIVLAVAFLGKPVAERMEARAQERAFARAPKPKPARAAPSTPTLARSETSVLVLNGNGRAGAATEAGARVQGLGYLIASVGNAPRSDYARTLVMYRPGARGEAQRLAKDLGGAVVAPLDGMKPAELMGAHVALILGAR